MIEKRDGSYYVHDLRSTLGTIVNRQPIGEHFRSDDASLRAGENEVIAGGVDSRFVFSVLIALEKVKTGDRLRVMGLSAQRPTYGPPDLNLIQIPPADHSRIERGTCTYPAAA